MQVGGSVKIIDNEIHQERLTTRGLALRKAVHTFSATSLGYKTQTASKKDRRM